ncbi:2-phospho-L-lactate transferase, partial [Candidatus Bathyarchaeota archaeon]|nr:2-phospho-L-lactate transferase [Candidatus Bathyarchaeota archaeon]
QSSLGVASIYRDLINTFIIDDEDRRLKEPIERVGMRVVVANTLMKTLDSKIKLAEIVLGELAE